MSGSELHRLLRLTPRQIWRANKGAQAHSGYPSGFPGLDKALPEQGWPAGAAIELVVPYWGMGEISLWLPLMRTHQQQGRYISWLAPPYLPYAPALCDAGLDLELVHYIPAPIPDRDLFWAAENLLRCADCGFILAWPRQVGSLLYRRLQLAAQHGMGQICLLRQPRQVWHATGGPSLRLRLRHTAADGTRIVIEKARGGWPGKTVYIDELNTPWAWRIHGQTAD